MNPQQALFQRAVAHMRAGAAEEAVAVSAEGLALDPDDSNFLCLAGRALIAL